MSTRKNTTTPSSRAKPRDLSSTNEGSLDKLGMTDGQIATHGYIVGLSTTMTITPELVEYEERQFIDGKWQRTKHLRRRTKETR